jgi:hypothetical protein
MLKDIVFAKAPGDYRLQVRFEDGVECVVDLAQRISFCGVFEPLRDTAYFARVRLDSDLGTVVWPDGADLDPDVLYADIANSAAGQELDFRLAG